MCKLLVHKTDKLPPDDERHHQFHKSGDVIAVLPDGWRFSPTELAHPDFLVFHAPGVTEEEASVFVAPHRVNEGELAHCRAFALDLDHPAISEKTTVTATDLTEAMIARQPVPDPRHIGPDPRVIG